MHFTLFKKDFKVMPKWAVDETDQLSCFIEIRLYINWQAGLFFSVQVNNKSFNQRNPFRAILAALESETVGMAKYDALKDRVRGLDMWRHL